MYLDDQRYAQLLEQRTYYPSLIEERARNRPRRSAPLPGQKLLIVAADHPARGMLGIGYHSLAMANRRDLLNRIIIALRQPGTDGILATADIIEELLLLGELDQKLVFGSMNRGGLAGSEWELNDPITAYTPTAIANAGLSGGKMLVRIDRSDRDTLPTLTSTAATIDRLAAENLIALIEPLPVNRNEGRIPTVSDSDDDLIAAISIASALGATSAYTWLKLPPPKDPERVFSSTTLPVLLLGGDPSSRPNLWEDWRRSLSVANVLGLVPGRSALYPSSGDVSDNIGKLAELVHS